MKKFLIVLSGIYLTLSGILLGLVFFLGFLSQLKASGMQKDAARFNSIKPFFIIILIAFALWPIITGVGVIFKKNWARISILLMSIFALLGGLCSLFVFMMPLPDNAAYNPQSIKLAVLGFNSIFFMIIPAAFLILFNDKSVKESFISKTEGKETYGRPFGISLVAFLSIFSGLSTLIFLFQTFIVQMPVLGSIMLSGNALKIYSLVLALVYIYIGIGLLRLQKAAWLSAVIFKIILLLQGIANILMISEADLSQMFSSFGKGISGMPLKDYKIMGAVGLLFPLAILIYLILKRHLFLYPPERR